MKRAGWLLVAISIAGCLEPGELSNSGAIYDAIAAQDPDADASVTGGTGGTSGTGGMSGSGGMGGSGGMSGSGGMGGSGATGECGDVLEDLLKPSCASTFCHSTSAMGPLDMEADDVGMRLIGKAGSGDCEDFSYINADAPAESLIYTKLDADPPCGTQMPFSGDKFTDEQKACVLEYIEQVVAEE